MSNQINIETGNPWCGKPASYTRFVLPFAYTPSKDNSGSNGLKWCRYEPEDKKRRENYFTKETNKVLFNHACWFELQKNNEPFLLSFTAFLKGAKPGNKYQLSATAKIVLFEFSEKPSANEMFSLLQTGFLILEVWFDDKQNPSLDELLRFNEAFRYKRVPFVDYPDIVAGKYKLDEPTDIFACEANKLRFHYWKRLLKIPLKYGNDEFNLIEKVGWDVYADDRTFVWTCAILPKGAEGLPKIFATEVKEKIQKDGIETFTEWEAHNYGHWIKLLNVDRPEATRFETNESSRFEREWAQERTYKRWEHSGTYYGFSYHSGALLYTDFSHASLWKDFGQMYFDIFLLLVYLRVTLFRFSTKLTDISGEARSKESNKIEKWRDDFEALRWNFALFTNLYQFPLISNQQQGLELYSLMRKCLDVEDLYQEIQLEINSSQEFLVQQVEQAQAKSTYYLTIIAALGLAVSIFLAFWTTDLGKDATQDLSLWLAGENGIFRVKDGGDVRWGVAVIFSVVIFILLLALGWICKLFANRVFLPLAASIKQSLFQYLKRQQ